MAPYPSGIAVIVLIVAELRNAWNMTVWMIMCGQTIEPPGTAEGG